MDGRDYDLSRAISASGARYLGRANEEPISFWNKGHQATLSIGDRTYPQCNQIVDEDEAAKLPHKEPSSYGFRRCWTRYATRPIAAVAFQGFISSAPPGPGPSVPPASLCSSRSEEHTSALQPLIRISYAVF